MRIEKQPWKSQMLATSKECIILFYFLKKLALGLMKPHLPTTPSGKSVSLIRDACRQLAAY